MIAQAEHSGAPDCPKCGAGDARGHADPGKCWACGFRLFEDPRAFRYLSESDLALARAFGRPQ